MPFSKPLSAFGWSSILTFIKGRAHFITTRPPFLEGLPHSWSLLVNLHDKGIQVTAQGWLQGLPGGEVGRVGDPDHIHVPLWIHGNAARDINTVPTQEGGVDEPRPRGIELGYKGVKAETLFWVERTRRLQSVSGGEAFPGQNAS